MKRREGKREEEKDGERGKGRRDESFQVDVTLRMLNIWCSSPTLPSLSIPFPLLLQLLILSILPPVSIFFYLTSSSRLTVFLYSPPFLP